MPRPSRLTWPALLSLLALTALTVTVQTGAAASLDTPVSAWLHAHATPAMISVARALNVTGLLGVTLAATALTAAWTFTRSRRAALLLLTGMGATLAAQLLLNAAVHRPRPTLYPHLVAAPGLSYPSGHAALAAALGTLLSVLLRRTRARTWAVTLTASYALSMGAARVLLGVHAPSDVLAGWLLGVTVSLGVTLLLEHWWPRRDHPT